VKPVQRRLANVEAVLRPPLGCAICQRWDGTVVGDDTGKRSRPEVCPGCGRLVPVRMLAIVVGMDLDRL